LPLLLDDHGFVVVSIQLVLPGSHVVLPGSNVVDDGLTVVDGLVAVGRVVPSVVSVSLELPVSAVESPSVPLAPIVKSLRPHPSPNTGASATSESQDLMVW
jgi:hypothetical protein